MRQGDPIAQLLFIIQIEPFLRQLHRYLPGLQVGRLRVKVAGYVDDVDTMGDSDRDIITINILAKRFESMSGQILNRNQKTAILGLGAWSGRLNWPLPWLHSPDTLKVFGVRFGPSLAITISASWSATLQAAKLALAPWRGRGILSLKLRRDVLETYVFSRLWYMAQILPLPSLVAQQLTTMAGSYLWKGHLERLALQELHSQRSEGGLKISCLVTRAQALLAKQVCWSLGHGGQAAGHWSF